MSPKLNFIKVNDKAMKYDWKNFTEKSDKRYKIARDNQDIGDLKRHNILKNGELEYKIRILECEIMHYEYNIETGISCEEVALEK